MCLHPWLGSILHQYCTTRFQDLDDQLHNVHDLLSNVYNRDNPRNEWRGWLISHSLHFRAAFCVLVVCASILIGQFIISVDWLYQFLASWSICISVSVLICLYYVSAALIHSYVTALMKIFIFATWSMHLLSFDESKGG